VIISVLAVAVGAEPPLHLIPPETALPFTEQASPYVNDALPASTAVTVVILLLSVGTFVNAQVVTEALRAPSTAFPTDVSTVNVPEDGASEVLNALATASVYRVA
jgi:hypothetical protein